MDPSNTNDTNSPVGNGQGLWGGNRGNGDTSLQYATGALRNLALDSSNSNRAGTNGDFDPAHFDGANYLAADGHVKWFKPSAISAGFNRSSSTSASAGNEAEGADYGGADKHAMTFSFK